MAELKSYQFNEDEIEMRVSITREEYNLIGVETSNLMIFPLNNGFFEKELKIGKSGTSNRIMLPPLYLKAHGINELGKESQSKLFENNGDKYLLAKLSKSK